MNQPMRLLYDHVLDTSFNNYLLTPEYRSADALTGRLSDKLRHALSGEERSLFENYTDAVQKLQLLELEAMFQAAFTLPRELR